MGIPWLKMDNYLKIAGIATWTNKEWFVLKENITVYKYKTQFYQKYADLYNVHPNSIKKLCLGNSWKKEYKEIIGENT